MLPLDRVWLALFILLIVFLIILLLILLITAGEKIAKPVLLFIVRRFLIVAGEDTTETMTVFLVVAGGTMAADAFTASWKRRRGPESRQKEQAKQA